MRLGLDAGDTIATLDYIVNALKRYNLTVDQVAQSIVKTNDANKLLQATLKGVNDSGNQVSVVLKRVKGDIEVVGTVTKELTKDLDIQRIAAEKAARAIVVGLAPHTARPIGTTQEETQRFERAREKLQAYVVENDIAEAKIRSIWSRTLAEPTFVPKTAAGRDLQKEMLPLMEAQIRLGNQAAETRDRETRAIEKESVALGNYLTNLRTEATALRQSMIARQALETGARRTVAGITGPTIAPAGTTRGEIIDYRTAQANLQSFIVQNEIGATRVRDIWRRTMADATFVPRDTQSRELQARLIALNTAQRNLGATAKVSAAEQVAAAQQVAAANRLAADQIIAGARQATVASEGMLISWRSISRLMVVSLGYRAMYSMISGFQEGASRAKELSIAIGRIQTISQDAQLTTDKWESGLKRLSDSWGLDILDQAKAAYEAISNQITKGAETFGFMESANKLAVTSVSTVAESVDVLSGIINAYGMDVSDAEEISAKLFKTVDLGRVVLSEMSGRLGTVAVMAKQMGISLEELLAMLSFLTRQGIKADVALTQIRGIMNKLMKPTKDMSGFLDELGVSSGEAATAAYGFYGIMSKLGEKTHGASSEVADFFNNMRGTSGALAITSDGAKEYAKDLDAITNASDEYGRATKYIMQSSGKIVEIELNKIKNLFVSTYGTQLTKSLADFIKLTGGFTSTIETTINAVSVLATVLIGKYVASLVIAVPSTFRLAAAQKELAIATDAMIVADTAAARTMVANAATKEAAILKSIASMKFAIIAAAVIGVGYLITKINEATDAILDMEKQAEDAATKIKDEHTKVISKSFEKLEKQVDAVFKSIFESIAKQTAHFNKELDLSKSRVKDISDKIKEYQAAVLKTATEALTETRRQITESESSIKSLTKTIASLGGELERQKFDIRLEGLESLTGKRTFVESEIERIKEKLAGIKLTQPGAKEDVDELLKTLSDMLKKREELIKESNRRVKEREKILRETQFEAITPTIETKALLESMNQVKAKGGDWSKIYEEIKKKQAEVTSEQIKGEDEILKVNDLWDIYQTKLIDITKLFSKGDITIKEFQNKHKDIRDKLLEQVETKEILNSAEESANELYKIRLEFAEKLLAAEKERLALLKSEEQVQAISLEHVKSLAKRVEDVDTTKLAKDPKAFEKFKKDLYEMQSVLMKVDTSEARAQLDRYEDKLQEVEEFVGVSKEKEQLEVRRQNYTEGRKHIKDQTDLLKKQSESQIESYSKIEGMLKANSKFIKEMGILGRGQLFTTGWGWPGQKVVDQVDAARARLKAAQETLPSLLDTLIGAKVVTGADAKEKAKKVFDTVSVLLDDAKKQMELTPGKVPDILLAYVKQLEDIKVALDTNGTGFINLKSKTLEAEKALKSLETDVLPKLKTEVEKQPSAWVPFTDSINDNLAAVKAHLEYLEKEKKVLEELSVKLPTVEVPETQPFARGGPIGRDTIPAMLSPGEFVMNPRSTSRFYSQLIAMNSGTRNFARGGPVNVGDINISVTGGNTSELTINRIGQGLRQAIRRGTLKLGG